MENSSGKGLAVAGFILGLLGAGLGGFVFFNETIAPLIGLAQNPPTITNYYSTDEYHNFAAAGIYEPLDDINLSISVPSNAEVYILFTCNAMYGSGASASDCYYQFLFDSTPFGGVISTTGDQSYSDSVTLQYYGDQDFTPGNHEVTVRSYVGNSNDVLTDISFSIFERESLGIMGENGSGKTTLALILAGVLKPKQGSIMIDGKPIGSYKRKQAIRKIGVLFQNPDDNILTTKVSNEILYAPWIQRLSEDEKQKLLNKNLDLMNLKGYDGKGTFKISYGERERVAIASLLVSQPNILIFDEPTTGQDYRHKQDFIKLAQKLNETHTLITISHDLEFLRAISNRVLLLENGKITETQINISMVQNKSKEFRTESVQLSVMEN